MITIVQSHMSLQDIASFVIACHCCQAHDPDLTVRYALSAFEEWWDGLPALNDQASYRSLYGKVHTAVPAAIGGFE